MTNPQLSTVFLVRRNFIVGLTTPGILSFTVAGATTCLLLIVLLFSVNERFFSRYGYRLFGSPDSHDWTFVSQQALRLNHADRITNAAAITFLGASQFTEMLSSVENLKADLEAANDGQIEVNCLSVPGQSIWETFGFVEKLGKDYQGLIVVEVGTVLWRRDYDSRLSSPKFAFRSAALDEISRKRGGPIQPISGIFLWDNRGYFLPRSNILLRNIFHSPPAPYFHIIPDMESMKESEMKEVLFTRRNRMATQAAKILYSGYTFEEGLVALDDCLSTLKELNELSKSMRNATVVFFRPPDNPEMMEILNQYVEDKRLLELNEVFWGKVSVFTNQHSIPLVDLSRMPSITPADFYDHCHIGTRRARQAATKELANLVVKELKDQNYQLQ